MKQGNILGVPFFFPALLIPIILLLVLIGYTFQSFVLNPAYQIVLVIISFTLILMVVNVYALMGYRKQKLAEHQHKEHTIRDYYRYHKVMDPPNMDT